MIFGLTNHLSHLPWWSGKFSTTLSKIFVVKSEQMCVCSYGTQCPRTEQPCTSRCSYNSMRTCSTGYYDNHMRPPSACSSRCTSNGFSDCHYRFNPLCNNPRCYNPDRYIFLRISYRMYKLIWNIIAKMIVCGNYCYVALIFSESQCYGNIP